MYRRRCVRSVSVTACPVHVQWKLVGCGCRVSGPSAMHWRIASTAPLESWCTIQTWKFPLKGTTQRHTECLAGTGTGSNWGRTTRTTRRQERKTLCTWSLRQGSARGIPGSASRERTVEPVTTPASASTAVTWCAAAAATAQRPWPSWNAVTAPSTGAAKSSVNFVASRKWFTRVYRRIPRTVLLYDLYSVSCD